MSALARPWILLTAATLALAGCKPAPAGQEATPPAPPPAVEPVVCTVSQPANGSPERVAVLDALRPAVEQMTGKPVEFVVTRLDVACDYARVVADPRAKAGTDRYETIDALMVRKDGAWTLGLMAAGEEDSPPAGQQYRARYADVPAALAD
ncbi:MAG: hypothetical protein K1X35_05220 [Caulobacteraceae bacterium]|nr:hypothetical protein [Caulobacteraceae bacterium]